jgi:hypothetical protein
VHFIVFPRAGVGSVVCPGVLALSFDVSIHKLAVVLGSVLPFEDPGSILQPVGVRSFKFALIRPCFLALSVLLIVNPVT